MKKLLILLALVLGFNMTYGENKSNSIEYVLKSPGGKIDVKISVGDKICYSVMHDNTVIIKDSEISMELGDGSVLGQAGSTGSIKNVETISIDEFLDANFYM